MLHDGFAFHITKKGYARFNCGGPRKGEYIHRYEAAKKLRAVKAEADFYAAVEQIEECSRGRTSRRTKRGRRSIMKSRKWRIVRWVIKVFYRMHRIEEPY